MYPNSLYLQEKSEYMQIGLIKLGGWMQKQDNLSEETAPIYKQGKHNIPFQEIVLTLLNVKVLIIFRSILCMS